MDMPLLRGLARNPALPFALLDRLVEVDDTAVRMALARRHDLAPHHVRALLVAEDAAKVAGSMLRAGLVDEAGMREFAADPRLRSCLVHVEELPADLVDLLVESDTVLVAQYRRLAPELAESLSRHPDRRVRRALARNASAPPAVLALLSSEAYVSLALAENPATPAAVLAELAAHESFAVRRVTAGRADLPHQLYEQLAADEERVVREQVAANRAAPEHLR